VQVVDGVDVPDLEQMLTDVGEVDVLRVDSSMTSTVSRSSFQVRGRIITPIRIEASASARAQPVNARTDAR
jgi:hypothetical protein